MSIFSRPRALATQGLSMLRSVGAWVAIEPAQTYVATSIPGLGTCKSSYCHAVRRELPKRTRRPRTASSKALALAAVVLLTGCAGRPARLEVTDRGQTERVLADCQNQAAPVSPGAAAGRCSQTPAQTAGHQGFSLASAPSAAAADSAAGDASGESGISNAGVAGNGSAVLR